MYVCGLNNYGQLGIPFSKQLLFTLGKSISFTEVAAKGGLKCVAPGQHHSLLLDNKGKVSGYERLKLSLGK